MQRLLAFLIGLAVVVLLLILYTYVQAQQQCEDYAYKNGVVTWFTLGTCYLENDRGELHELMRVN